MNTQRQEMLRELAAGREDPGAASRFVKGRLSSRFGNGLLVRNDSGFDASNESGRNAGSRSWQVPAPVPGACAGCAP